jgi:DNA-binding MarR family transcriptional regulator
MAEESISESTGYLIAQACKRHRKKAGELLAALDLHVGQEMLLLQLWNRDGQTQSELAEGLGVEPATVTRVLDRMTCTGWVERRKDSEDRRVSRVYLTVDGRDLQQPVQETWQTLEELSMANFSVTERVLLRRFLNQLVENLDC